MQEQLNKNSNNSHRKTGKKNGGQVGHKGNTLKKIANPDYTVIHFVENCPWCNKKFVETDVVNVRKSRQVFDLIEPKIEVTEYQIGVVKCCGKYHRANFPAWLKNHAQYGNRIRSLAVNLNNQMNMPV